MDAGAGRCSACDLAIEEARRRLRRTDSVRPHLCRDNLDQAQAVTNRFVELAQDELNIAVADGFDRLVVSLQK